MEYDLNTFLYDAGSLKVGNKSVLKKGALFPMPLSLLLFSVHMDQLMSRVGIKFLKNSSRRTC